MVEDEQAESLDNPYPRAYDFFKHLTGVSLISLGGIIGLLGGQGPDVPKAKLIVLMGFIGVSGAVSLFTAATIVSASDLGDRKQVSTKSVRLSMGIAVWSLALGLGAAIQAFATVLM